MRGALDPTKEESIAALKLIIWTNEIRTNCGKREQSFFRTFYDEECMLITYSYYCRGGYGERWGSTTCARCLLNSER
jgi:hypothetical protein